MSGKSDPMTTHHFYWPRKKYSQKGYRQVKMRIPYELHMSYHEFYLHNCRNAHKVCFGCRYTHLCCYKEV